VQTFLFIQREVSLKLSKKLSL